MPAPLARWFRRPPAVWRRRGGPDAAVQGPPAPLRLALQGGGAHGAWTWGVLDALLDDPRCGFSAASGASAGAMNAAVLAHGLAEGGAGPGDAADPGRLTRRARDAARAALERFWITMAERSPFERHAQWLLRGDPQSPRLSPMAWWLFDWTSRFAPQQLNPGDVNPLRDLLAEQLDVERLRRASPLPLFLAATSVHTGRPRVFREHEVDVAALLASACLPKLHHPVERDGETLWDGGFSANPPLAPLLFDLPPDAGGRCEVLLVTLSPGMVDDVPSTPRAIAHRQTDLAFAAPLLAELRWLEHLQQAVRDDDGALPWTSGRLARRIDRVRLHRLALDEPPADDVPTVSAAPEGKLIANVAAVRALHEAGRAAARAWLRGFGAAGH